MIGFHWHAIGRLTYGHNRGSRQDLGKYAAVAGIEMLNEYDRKAGIAWQIAEQMLKNLQPAGRSPNTNHWDFGLRRRAIAGLLFGQSCRFRIWEDLFRILLSLHGYLQPGMSVLVNSTIGSDVLYPNCTLEY